MTYNIYVYNFMVYHDAASVATVLYFMSAAASYQYAHGTHVSS